MEKHHAKIPYRRDLRQKSRNLRKSGTLGEVLLWRAVKARSLGVQFRRQVPLGIYIVDFLCHERSLVVEIDGGTHDHEEQVQYDERRSAWLKEQGFRVLRFSEMDVRKNIDGVVETLRDCLALNEGCGPQSGAT
jgi:very-short-patch-repair endonuclease